MSVKRMVITAILLLICSGIALADISAPEGTVVNDIITYEVEGHDVVTKERVKGTVRSKAGTHWLHGSIQTEDGLVGVEGVWIGLGIIRVNTTGPNKTRHFELQVLE